MNQKLLLIAAVAVGLSAPVVASAQYQCSECIPEYPVYPPVIQPPSVSMPSLPTSQQAMQATAGVVQTSQINATNSINGTTLVQIFHSPAARQRINAPACK